MDACVGFHAPGGQSGTNAQRTGQNQWDKINNKGTLDEMAER
jgi:hypothetical protein